MGEFVLPNGVRLRADNLLDMWAEYFKHAAAALSERMCPLCSTQLESEACFDSRHRPIWWHLCTESVSETYLDVPMRHPETCEGCGQTRWAPTPDFRLAVPGSRP